MDENQMQKITEKISMLDEMQQVYLMGFVDALLYKQEQETKEPEEK